MSALLAIHIIWNHLVKNYVNFETFCGGRLLRSNQGGGQITNHIEREQLNWNVMFKNKLQSALSKLNYRFCLANYGLIEHFSTNHLSVILLGI